MGTLVGVKVYLPSGTARQAAERVFARMAEVEAEVGVHRPESPLAPLREGTDLVLNKDQARLLDFSLEVARLSSGAFDPTLGEVSALWGFSDGDPRLPREAEIRKALGRVGFRRLIREGPRLSAGPRGAWIDLGGVAKGFAVDEAVKALSPWEGARGIVNAAGDMAVVGLPPGRDRWKIGIQDPDDPQGLVGVLSVRRGAVSTSGDYQRFFEREGIRYHHILDPATGYPARGLRSVTVLAPTCVRADALATAVFVLGPEKGLALLARAGEGVEGVLVAGDGRILTTPGIGDQVGFERGNP